MWIFLYLLHYPVLGILRQRVAASVQRPCQLPHEYHQMPVFAKEKLRSIWENYKSGKSCIAEQIATDVVLRAVRIIFPAKYQHRGLYNSHYGCNTTNNISLTVGDEAIYDEALASKTVKVPEFLEDVSKHVTNSFMKVWNDPDIPSEGLREEMIHLLAVSLLTAKQLAAYNQYMNERRRCQRQLLFHIQQMSDEARKALSILAYAEPNERFGIAKKFSRSIRYELRDFARRRSGKCL
ncbi:unnamed protein product [Litomosoides sigmodontis]|uniref:Uncharacterized protein n=1 Tax=Litomosoides sigmodontis TaxID=42156 RepID=A0A3P7M4W5_LITSI|nr:unnamed protein product [Litomosoides sigmodontis]